MSPYKSERGERDFVFKKVQFRLITLTAWQKVLNTKVAAKLSSKNSKAVMKGSSFGLTFSNQVNRLSLSCQGTRIENKIRSGLKKEEVCSNGCKIEWNIVHLSQMTKKKNLIFLFS